MFVIVLLFIAMPLPGALQPGERPAEMSDAGLIVVDFSKPLSGSWIAVNDGVMGGLSTSGIRETGAGSALFAGELSLENNGGFASVRTVVDATNLSDYDGLSVRVRGDGKQYRLRLRTDGRFDGIAYQARFDTAVDEWKDVFLPFSSFVPVFRGRTVRGAPALDTTDIRQISFMIADGQAGIFTLEIAWVCAGRSPAAVDGDPSP